MEGDGWVSIKDEKPQLDTNVLAGSIGGTAEAYRYGTNGFRRLYDMAPAGCQLTHWRPLPELPKPAEPPRSPRMSRLRRNGDILNVLMAALGKAANLDPEGSSRNAWNRIVGLPSLEAVAEIKRILAETEPESRLELGHEKTPNLVCLHCFREIARNNELGQVKTLCQDCLNEGWKVWVLRTKPKPKPKPESHEESRPGDEMLPCPYCMDWVSDILGAILDNRTMVYSKKVAVCPHCKRSPRAMAEVASDDWRKRVGRAIERRGNG